MATYFALILAFVGALWWFNHQRQARLDADLGQRRLAELLTGAATGGGTVSARAVRDHLTQISTGDADRRVRLTHAVMLVRGEATPDLYEQVLRFSREL
jgi:hypothetical protein